MNLVANPSDILDRPSLWVIQRPIVSTRTWDDRTFVAASHRNEHGRSRSEPRCQHLWLRGGEIDPGLSHDCHDLRMHALAGTRAGRHRPRRPWSGQSIEECRSHLRAAGIVNAGKYDEVGGHGLAFQFRVPVQSRLNPNYEPERRSENIQRSKSALRTSNRGGKLTPL